MVKYKVEYLKHDTKTNEVEKSVVNVEGSTEEQILTILDIFDSGLYSQGYKQTTPRDAENFVKYEKVTENQYYRVIVSE